MIIDDLPRLVFNGIDPTTGEEDIPAARWSDLASSIQSRWDLPSLRRQLRTVRRQASQQDSTKGEPAPGVDPLDLASSGWGVIFPRDVDPAVRAALDDLFEHRRAQAGERFVSFHGDQGYLPRDDADRWLTRQGVGPGPADPHRGNVPYYLLLVGGPEAIPFTFQYGLAARYAVGRLCFDTVEGYGHYAANVLRAESSSSPAARRVAVFGVDNPDDAATTYSQRYLAKPLVAWLDRHAGEWEVVHRLGEVATKAELVGMLSGDARPSLLLTTSHGLGPDRRRPPGDQLGALLCQDWPGPIAWRQRQDRTLPRNCFFAGTDVEDDWDLTGLVSLHFACFSAGMPDVDSFAHEQNGEPRRLGPTASVAPLPQRLLGKPKGALAVVGHIDRARGFSIIWPGAGSQSQIFEWVLGEWMSGKPIGYAVRFLSDRRADIELRLNALLMRALRHQAIDPVDLVDLWTASVDARGYIVLGDPAARRG